MLGAQSSGNRARPLDLPICCRPSPVVAITIGISLGQARRDDGLDRGGHGEVDRPRPAVAASRVGARARHCPSAATPATRRHLRPGADAAARPWPRRAKARIGGSQSHQPPSHAAGRSVNGNAKGVHFGFWSGFRDSVFSFQWSGFTEIGDSENLITTLPVATRIALMISSRSLATATARLARRPGDAAAAEHLIELLLVRRMVGDGGRGVLELMAGEDADHPLVAADHPFGHQLPGAGHAGGAGRLAAQARLRRPGPWRRGSPGRSPRGPRRCKPPAPAGTWPGSPAG